MSRMPTKVARRRPILTSHRSCTLRYSDTAGPLLTAAAACRLAAGLQPAGHDQGAVVGEGDAADEGFEVGVEGGGEGGAGGLAVAAAEVGEAVVAVLLAVRVVGLDDAGGVEKEGVAGRQQHLGGLVGGGWQEGDRHA